MQGAGEPPRNLYSPPLHSYATHLENFFSTHLQVVVGTLPVIAGRLDPEHVPEVDADKVAVLCRDHSAKVGAHLKTCFYFIVRAVSVQ